MALFENKNPDGMEDRDSSNERNIHPEEETPVASFATDPFGSFTMGVLDVFTLKEHIDVVVVGRISGKALFEDAVYVTNLGDEEETISFTNLAGIEVDKQQVPSAENCLAAVRIRDGYKMNIRPGTVIFTRDQGAEAVRRSYMNTMGEYFIQKRQMNLTKQERLSLTLTDTVELSRIYRLFLEQIDANMTQSEKEEAKRKIENLNDLMMERLLGARSVYVVLNRKTQEPHMFSMVSELENGSYYCAPPDIRLIPKPYVKIVGPKFDPKIYEIREIKNDEVDRNRIAEFLDQMIHLNGAEAVSIIYNNYGFTAKEIEPKLAKYRTEEPKQEGADIAAKQDLPKPVSNPALERWILLLGQTDPESSPEEHLAYRLYYRFMAKELPNAKFLVPLSEELEGATLNPDYTITISEGDVINLPTIPGKNDLPATLLFTDWRHLRIDHPESNALILTIPEILEITDCVINFTKESGFGIYLSKESYQELLNLES